MQIVKIFQHAGIADKDLHQIAKIKSLRWNYSEEEHLQWMKDNLLENDHHLLMFSNDDLVGYANLFEIKVNVNNQSAILIGIGNVCTSESGNGYGEILMKNINEIIMTQNRNGVLLCKDHLVPYYEKYEWKLVDKDAVKSEQYREINMMLFNFDTQIMSLEYSGRNF